MTVSAEAPDSLRKRDQTGTRPFYTMTNKNHQRGEKRGVLSTDRSKSLDTGEDDSADAANDHDDSDESTEG